MIGALVVVLGGASGAGLWWYRQSTQHTSAGAISPQATPGQVTAPDPGAGPPTDAATVPSQTPPESTPPPTGPTGFPSTAEECRAGQPVGDITRSASGNPVTTCAFAESVREAYGEQPRRDGVVDIIARSPATGQSYAMSCTAGRPISCRGGKNALVYLL